MLNQIFEVNPQKHNNKIELTAFTITHSNHRNPQVPARYTIYNQKSM